MRFRPAKIATTAQKMDDNMVPLINVVFLMLIFFMVAGQIQKSDPVKVSPPSSTNTLRQAVDAPVQLVMGANGVLFLNDDVIAIEALAPAISSLQIAWQSSDIARSHEFSVQLKADGETDLGHIKPIFNQLKAAGVRKVHLSTQLLQEAN
jgi:biopolymer transport protein ExbD